MTPIQVLRRGACRRVELVADEPDRAAAGRAPRAPGDPADRRARALRDLDGAAAAGRPRARAVGRAAVRPDPAHPDVVRRDEHRRVVRRAAAVDPAAPVARARHGAQRRRHRGGDRRDARRRAPTSRGWAWRVARHAAGDRRQRGGGGDVHRQPARARAARRADDRAGAAHRSARSGWCAPRSRSPSSCSASPLGGIVGVGHRALRAAHRPVVQLFLPMLTVRVERPAPRGVRASDAPVVTEPAAP